MGLDTTIKGNNGYECYWRKCYGVADYISTDGGYEYGSVSREFLENWVKKLNKMWPPIQKVLKDHEYPCENINDLEDYIYSIEENEIVYSQLIGVVKSFTSTFNDTIWNPASDWYKTVHQLTELLQQNPEQQEFEYSNC